MILKNRWFRLLFLGAVILGAAGCNKPDLRALNKSKAKGAKPTAYQETPKPLAVALLGFAPENDPGNRLWAGYGLSYFISEKLRTDGSRVLLDPVAVGELLPDLDMHLLSKSPSDQTLVDLKNLLQVDVLTFATYRIVGDAVSLRLHTFTAEGTEEIEFTRSFNALPALDREVTAYLAGRLHPGLADLADPNSFKIGGVPPGAKPFELDSKTFTRMTPANMAAYQEATLGIYFSSIGWYAEATLHLEKAVKADPDFLNGFVLLAEMYLIENRSDLVVPTLKRPTQYSPDDFYVWYLLGKAYLALSDFDKAKDSLEKCKQLDPSFGDCSQVLAIIYRNVNELQKGKESLSDFLLSNPMTGAQMAKAIKYARSFSMRPEARQIMADMKALQTRQNNFQSRMAALMKKVEYQTEWYLGKSASGPLKPYDILRDAGSNRFFVVEQSLRQVLTLDMTGKVESQLDLHDQTIMPFRLASYRGNSLLITDGLGDQIVMADAANSAVSTFSKAILKPTGIVAVRDVVYVLDSKHYEITVLDGKGAIVSRTRLPSDLATKSLEPSGIAVGPDGLLYVTDALQNFIFVLSKDGQVLRRIGGTGRGPGEFQQPRGIAVDGAGRIFVTDSYNSRIQVLDSSGVAIAVFGAPGSGSGQLASPAGIATDGKGMIYVADTGNGRIQVLKLK